MRQAVALVALALLGCKPRADLRPDPVRVDAAPPVAVAHARVVRGGEVVDFADARVVHVLVDKPPAAEINDDTRAFLYGKDFVLRAFDLASGKEAWSRPIPPTLRPLLMDDAFVYAVAESTITIASKQTGDLNVVTPSKPILRATAAGGKLIVARHDRAIEVFDPKVPGKGGVVALTLAFDPIGHRSDVETLADGVTACAVASDGRLRVHCFDASGAPRAHDDFDLRTPAAPTAGVRVITIDDRYVLFASDSLRRSIVVRLADGGVAARVEDNVAAIVKREDGSIAGLLVIEPELRLLDVSGVVRWTAKRSAGFHESASAVARGNALYVATYPEFSSGSDLTAYDLASGKQLWKADVERLPIGHSEYFNEVRLSIVDDRLALRGDESSIITTQLFDLASGKRLLAASHMR